MANSWASDLEGWYEAKKNGLHRQFIRIRLDIERQEYVVDAIGQERKYSEELRRY